MIAHKKGQGRVFDFFPGLTYNLLLLAHENRKRIEGLIIIS